MNLKETKSSTETQGNSKFPFLKTCINNPIVCGIILIIIASPITSFVEAVKSNSGNILLAFDNLFFKMAAVATEFTIPTFVTQNSLVLILIYCYFTYLKTVNLKFPTTYKSKQSHKDIIKTNEIHEEKLEENTLKLKVEFQKKRNLVRKGKFLLVFTLFFTIFIFIYMILPSKILSDFNINITKITPYTDSHTIAVLKSDWVQMKSRNDYNNIKKRIDIIWRKHNTKSDTISSENTE